MWKSKKIACVIPARLQSTRFPRKILAPLQGKPLIQRVWEAARQVSLFDEVVFAIDAEETAQVIEKFQGRYFMTSESCPSGTDRLVELQKKGHVKADIWVNWQADGPFITEKVIQDLLMSCDERDADVWTLKKRLVDLHEAEAVDVCKVVTDVHDFALYFSRSLIPYYRKVPNGSQKKYYKHIGLYAFSDEGLKKISTLSPCELEINEQLEQLRWLYHGLKVKVHETDYETLEIDLPEHLIKAQKIFDGE